MPTFLPAAAKWVGGFGVLVFYVLEVGGWVWGLGFLKGDWEVGWEKKRNPDGDRVIGVVLLCAHPRNAFYVAKWTFTCPLRG